MQNKVPPAMEWCVGHKGLLLPSRATAAADDDYAAANMGMQGGQHSCILWHSHLSEHSISLIKGCNWPARMWAAYGDAHV